jgi:hypothetical protein
MKTPINTLLKKAAKAVAPQRDDKSSYKPLLPAIQTLLERGFILKDAVRWLQEQKQIPDGEKALHRAYCSIRQALSRRNKTV